MINSDIIDDVICGFMLRSTYSCLTFMSDMAIKEELIEVYTTQNLTELESYTRYQPLVIETLANMMY